MTTDLKKACYDLAMAYSHKPWARRWLRENGHYKLTDEQQKRLRDKTDRQRKKLAEQRKKFAEAKERLA